MKIILAIIIILGLSIGLFFVNNKAQLSILEERQIVETYLAENISQISPEKEVLGGKFYILKIDWLENKAGKIDYEDGHIMLSANFTYEVNPQNKAVNIKNFEIIE